MKKQTKENGAVEDGLKKAGERWYFNGRLDFHFKQLLEKEIFSLTVDDDWFNCAWSALEKTSPDDLGLKLLEYCGLSTLLNKFMPPKSLSLFEVGCLINSLEQRTFRELKISRKEYDRLQMISDTYSDAFEIQTTKMKEQVRRLAQYDLDNHDKHWSMLKASLFKNYPALKKESKIEKV